MPRTQRIAFLCSGGGGNLNGLCEAVAAGILPGHEVCGVIVDRPCPAVAIAAARDIPASVTPYSRTNETALLDALAQLNPDIVVTTIHRVLGADVVGTFRGRLVNLHYSLLPAFGGLIGDATVRAALSAGCTIVGTTVHHVDETLDAGRIIGQTALAVRSGEDFRGLMRRVFQAGCVNLANSIALHAGFPLRTDPAVLEADTPFMLSPGLCIDASLFTARFWQTVELGATAHNPAGHAGSGGA